MVIEKDDDAKAAYSDEAPYCMVHQLSWAIWATETDKRGYSSVEDVIRWSYEAGVRAKW